MARPDFIPESGFGTVSRHGWQEVVVPDVVAYSPATWGWWLIAVLALAATAYGLGRWLRFRTENRYRRDALKEFDRIQSLVLKGEAPAVRELSVLLKRVAIHAFDRREVASLTGAAWASFLTRTCPEVSFSAALLEELTCKGPGGVAADELARYASNSATWIRRHDASV